jgi:hypothetical protein
MSKLRDDRPELFLVAVIACVLGWAAASNMDYHDGQVEQQHYCEMVELWHENDHLPPEQRPGWPPYKGECNGQD